MFERFSNVFNKSLSVPGVPSLSKDAIAELLRISPEALAAFENAYEKHALNQNPEDFFSTNSRQAASQKRSISENTLATVSTDELDALKRRIVNELLAETAVFTFDGNKVKVEHPKALPEGSRYVEKGDIEQFPLEFRPQLSGNLMKRDISESSYPTLLWYYEKAMNSSNPKQSREAYHRFRQGLDILDLDPVMYEMIGTNPNSMGHWLPQLADACSGNDFFKIPATTIVKVPLTLLQLTRQEYSEMTQTTLDIVNEWAKEAFKLKGVSEYFIKTGTYSSKFDFRNAHVHGAKEVEELGEYLLYIHYQALQMAGPLCKPCIYGVSTTNEWVVREFIPDKENNPSIYKGLPLHTEYRVFVDCDTDKVIGITPYWEPDTMKQRFGHGQDANSPHQLHDYVIYKAHEETLMKRYEENCGAVREHIEALLPDLDLKGQWSVDVMQNGDDFWIIDMALAEHSAFYECVPVHLRNPSKENWIPHIPELKLQKSSLDSQIQAAMLSESSNGSYPGKALESPER